MWTLEAPWALMPCMVFYTQYRAIEYSLTYDLHDRCCRLGVDDKPFSFRGLAWGEMIRVTALIVLMLAACQDVVPDPTAMPNAISTESARPTPTVTMRQTNTAAIQPTTSKLPIASPTIFPTPIPISWPEAEQLVLSGEVVGVGQLHSLDVALTTRDGTIYITIEPHIGEILRVIDRCGEPCEGILVASE